MTNQASEDKQIDDVLTNAIDYYISGNGVQPEAISRVKSLIRTEKLKLLAEVRERVIGEDETRIPADGGPFTNTTDKPNHYITLRNANRADQRAALTKLEAEL